jgi:hypothetical protein
VMSAPPIEDFRITRICHVGRSGRRLRERWTVPDIETEAIEP